MLNSIYLVIGIIGGLFGIASAVIQIVNKRRNKAEIEAADKFLISIEKDLDSAESIQKIREKDAEYLILMYAGTVASFLTLKISESTSPIIQLILKRLRYIESVIPIEHKKADTTDGLGKIFYEANRDLINKILQESNISKHYGQFYSDHKGFQIQGGKELLKKCNIVNGQKILDVGCGDGYFAFEIAKQGDVKVDAVDNADDLIKKAEQTKEKDNITNVIFYHQDYRTFKNENQYDLIFSNFAIHWADKYYQDWLQNIYDSLKTGGQFAASISGSIIDKGKKIFTFYELSDGNNSVIHKAIKNLHFDKYFHNKNLHRYWSPTNKELEEALSSIGFKNIKVDMKNENCLNQAEYESWEDAYNNILATELNNYNEFLEKEKDRDSLCKECIKLCLEINPKYITAIDLYVTATK